MRRIQWNEGMSVGVDAIDSDHRRLLETINEINDAITEGKTSDVIEKIFVRLEQYVVEHFAREEALMEQGHYDELEQHRRQHQKFVNKVPQLKAKLLSADSMDVALEVSLFLTNWLMNHVIMEDMSYAQPVHDAGLSDRDRRPHGLLGRLSEWASRKIVLRQRIYLSALVPIAGLLILIGSMFIDHYREYVHMQQLLGLTDLVRDINQLSHRLQAERGLSTGYISSDYQDFAEQLSQQQNRTDRAIGDYQNTVQRLPQWLMNPDMERMLQIINRWIAGLPEQRQEVGDRFASVEAMQKHYTGTIRALLAIYSTMPSLTHDRQLSNHIAAISALVNMKEANGLERAQGTAILEGSVKRKAGYQMLSRLIGEYEGYLRIFRISADDEQRQRWRNFSRSKESTNARSAEMALIDYLVEPTVGIPISPDRWFEMMSNRMNHIQQLIEDLMVDIERGAERQVERVKWQLLTTSLFWLALLLLTIFFSWIFSQSIIRPIHRLTDAMGLLSQGDRDIRFTDTFAKDEIRKLYQAYEGSRRNFLKADIAMAVRFQKQEFTFEMSEREKETFEQLASIDPLTGAINRRKFLQLAEIEIRRAHRYQNDLSCLMLDIDHFKQINDRYGHAAGDQVLKAFFEACFHSVRDTDIVARIGGEEFVVLLPEISQKDALRLAERIRSEVAKIRVSIDERQVIELTVSIGASFWSEEITDIEELMEQADTALYHAKHEGRNRVVIAES